MRWNEICWLILYIQVNKVSSELFFLQIKVKGRCLYSLLHSLPLLRIRDLFSEEEKKSIRAKFIHGFLQSMGVHSEGLGGTRFIPVNVFEGELPLMLFSLPLRSKTILVLSRPGCHTGGVSLQSSSWPTQYLHSRGDGVEWWLWWGNERLVGSSKSTIPTVKKLIVNLVNAGNTISFAH